MSKTGRVLFQIVLFASFGTLMFISDIAMEVLPNIHLLAMFIVIFTVVYRVKALIPIYVYVFLTLFYSGFGTWALPYLYVWTVLWGIVMLLPKNMPPKIAVVVYMAVAGLHGILFGVLYAPAQMLLFGLRWEQMWVWIGAGLPFDVVHCIGNTVSGILILPLVGVLKKLPGAIIEKTE
ncbi:MAG: hypothetical protein J6S13_04150 [Clostridia bacterium]|nr:hypothetical protein [Clostridia bacterium]